jgi:hypothetical protein
MSQSLSADCHPLCPRNILSPNSIEYVSCHRIILLGCGSFWEACRRELEVGMESPLIGYAHAETAEPVIRPRPTSASGM